MPSNLCCSSHVSHLLSFFIFLPFSSLLSTSPSSLLHSQQRKKWCDISSPSQATTRKHWPLQGSYPETPASEVPAAAQMDGPDLAFPMSPRTSKSRMSMKLRRSSGSANKT
uniref:Uncharacterized protein n=1 Tax=Sphaerodactylus townsendi TaxID=933632 RepID=A0ACB8G5B5_9SAUR